MRYPASEKLEIIRLVERSHLPVRRTLDKLGIPATTFYRWYDRYRAFGQAGLEDRTSGPGRVWNRIPDDVRRQIVGRLIASLVFLGLLGAIGARAGGAHVLKATFVSRSGAPLAMALTAGIDALVALWPSEKDHDHDRGVQSTSQSDPIAHGHPIGAIATSWTRWLRGRGAPMTNRQRQWPGAHLARHPGMDQSRRPRLALHRARQAPAECLRRELHRPAAGRASERGDLREPRSRPAHARALAARLQPRPATFSP